MSAFSFETTEFDLHAIYDSGQVFTWTPLDPGGYQVLSGRKRCLARQSGNLLSIDGAKSDEAYWRHYFALDDDYPAILNDLAIPAEVLAASRGVRVLHQDWWDASISFIVSQNSNIPRITASVVRMSDDAGILAAPELAALLEADDCGLGYRRDYLRSFAASVADGWRPAALSHAVSLDDQIEELCRFKGIGVKVATCICLYGLEFMQAVPRDVWIKRVDEECGVAWDQRWGGMQQQFYYAWIRSRDRAPVP